MVRPYDETPNTIFANAAVPGAKSSDVLAFQVPQAINLFQPHVVMLSVGGNDVLAILAGADPAQVFQQFALNLGQILCCRNRASTCRRCSPPTSSSPTSR